MSLYAGRLCPRCKKGINKESDFLFLDKQYDKQYKRYGSNPCNKCITDLLGGVKKRTGLQQEQIKLEMGL